MAQATGLTSRALRFYEARGLVRPLRTAGGRGIYGRGELAPFSRVGTPEMATRLTRMYDDMDSCQGERTPPFPATVWAFIRDVGLRRRG